MHGNMVLRTSGEAVLQRNFGESVEVERVECVKWNCGSGTVEVELWSTEGNWKTDQTLKSSFSDS